ncbi:Putative protein in type-1 retrotransposable element R1DM [Araneus ventricosus]|uniref:Retrovirus-related Pol polyprotein from type-1 retrotransposable element R1 n=1 Tax=Araneus ventricosus TaxID=182803 RepID=A0A4Y2WIZ1_ARAVE|nr:Putative protein in type-1 retrotransposable element R1DM [Araneus ventricosus]
MWKTIPPQQMTSGSLPLRCLDLGHFPRPWEKAKLVLLNKPGKDTSDPRAYRPICLLSTMSKVLDKLVAQRILHHYHSNNLLNHLQHGFRARKSCETAGFELKSVVMEKVKANQAVCLISLDVEGAFDNVCWESILFRLGQANCPNNIFRLVRSYLRERWVLFETRATRVEHETKMGCPQGSCSGPIFWNIVADSLLVQTFPCKTYVQTYADDLVLVIWGRDKSEIEAQGEAAMAVFEEWGEVHELRFSPRKTLLLPITFRRKLSVADPPKIRLYGHMVQAVTDLTYLGVRWDGGLTFHEHFKNIRAVVDTLTYKLSIMTKKWYHKHPCLLKKIYKGAIEPKILFGHGAWGHRLQNKAFCEYMDVVQRRPLLAITRAFKTASTKALQVLAGVPPLDLKAIETHCSFLVIRVHEDVTTHGQSFSAEDYVKYESPYETHPAAKGGIGFDWVEPSGNGLEIYTDGSGINDRTGAAMVVLYYGQLIHSDRSRLSDTCTVYQAELFGLQLAAEFCLTLNATQRVNIYSDSRSALQSLADPTNLHPLVGKVRRLLQRARSDRGVHLHWVKAHVGYFGNELADREAKAAAGDPAVKIEMPTPISRLKSSLKAITIREWQERWEMTIKGRHTFKLFPKVSVKCLFWGMVNEVLSGHGRFPYYFYKYGLGFDDLCACGEFGDAMHYLVSCPLTDDIRGNMRFDPSCPETLVSLENIPHLCSIAKRVRGMTPNL